MIRHNTDLSVYQISAAGVSARQVRFSGVHGANNHRVYAQVIVPTANQIFGADALAPDVFSYRTADLRFSIWRYDVLMDRSHPALLALEDARRAGTSFSLRGSGAATVVTPPEFNPGRRYIVTYSSATREVERRELEAGQDRRLGLHIDLNNPAFATGSGLIPGLLGIEAAAYVKVNIVPRSAPE